MMSNLLIILACSLAFRIRGGLRIPFTDKKFPLNKFWFAFSYSLSACYLYGFSWSYFLTGLVASKTCTSIAGWGSYIGALYNGKVSEEDSDDLNITDFVKNTVFAKFLKKDYRKYGKLYGFITLSLRGGLTSFILGLWLNSVPFMFIGLLQGSVYWLGGWTCRHIYDDGKYGWKISEFYWGAVLGAGLILLTKFSTL